MTDSLLATVHDVGPVDIRVPAEPSLSRVVRLAASGLASLAGCTVDEIEDIKLAVSEVMIALIEHGQGDAVDIQLGAEGSNFSIRGSTAVTSFDTQDADLVLCRTVLAGVCADHRIEVIDGHALIWATVQRQPMV